MERVKEVEPCLYKSTLTFLEMFLNQQIANFELRIHVGNFRVAASITTGILARDSLPSCFSRVELVGLVVAG
jgi:hypothetical protein